MSLNTYTELTTEIQNYMDRNGLDCDVGTFISLAQSVIDRELRTMQMTCRTRIFHLEGSPATAVSGTESGSYLYSLPCDWRGMRDVSMFYNTQRVHLKYKTPAEISQYIGSPGIPQFYSIADDGLVLAPIPNGGFEIEMLYYQKIPPLGEILDNTGSPIIIRETNWLLERAPDVYLYGALWQAHAFVYDEQRAEYYRKLFDGVISDLKGEDWGDRWSGGKMAASMS